jgi:hypothetical protein
MAEIPDIIMQGASMVNQALQHQQRMKLEMDRFKLQKTQWEESLKWRQQEMEARVGVTIAEQQKQAIELETAKARLLQLQGENEGLVKSKAWTQIFYRPDVVAQDPSQKELVDSFAAMDNSTLMRESGSVSRQLTELASSGMINLGQEQRDIYNSLQQRLTNINREQGIRRQLYAERMGADSDKSTLNALTESGQQADSVLKGAAGLPTDNAGSAVGLNQAARSIIGQMAQQILSSGASLDEQLAQANAYIKQSGTVGLPQTEVRKHFAELFQNENPQLVSALTR